MFLYTDHDEHVQPVSLNLVRDHWVRPDAVLDGGDENEDRKGGGEDEEEDVRLV